MPLIVSEHKVYKAFDWLADWQAESCATSLAKRLANWWIYHLIDWSNEWLKDYFLICPLIDWQAETFLMKLVPILGFEFTEAVTQDLVW